MDKFESHVARENAHNFCRHANRYARGGQEGHWGMKIPNSCSSATHAFKETISKSEQVVLYWPRRLEQVCYVEAFSFVNAQMNFAVAKYGLLCGP